MEPKTLTPELRRAMAQLGSKRAAAGEIRLRCGRPATVVLPEGERLLTVDGRPIPVTDKLLKELLDRATGFSPYALKAEETGLFLPLEGGCRMGLCGEAVMREGRLHGLRSISSMAIRLAQEHRGVAQGAAKTLTQGGWVQSALIVSPPGRGKTTFLRDLVRAVSEMGYRVSVVDERRELAAAKDGVPQLDLGPSTDVLTGCPKADAIPLLIRVMNPQVLALDELAGERELEMAQGASFCGIALFATAHGDSLQSVMGRPGYGALVRAGAFAWCITLKTFDTVKMERLGSNAEDCGSVFCGGGVADERLGGTSRAEPAAADPAGAAAGAGADAGRNGTPYARRFPAV